ncbi:MAG TPA: hypothetical protein ENI91_05235 [Sphingomonadales bacterium]|nr:hypothetical protein [Sphingomonadales bacterium]
MTDQKNEISPADAQEALKAIQEAEGVALSQTMPPRWFGIIIALTTGALLASAAAGATELIAVFLAVMVGSMAYLQRKTRGSPKALPSNKKGVLALVGLLFLALALLAGARGLRDIYDLTWAPLAAGVILAVIVYILSLSERREYRDRINGEKEK